LGGGDDFWRDGFLKGRGEHVEVLMKWVQELPDMNWKRKRISTYASQLWDLYRRDDRIKGGFCELFGGLGNLTFFLA
jgi:hypothetical protein